MTYLGSSVKSIVAAIDDSERAPSVFATAVALASDLQAQLFLLRVLALPLDIPPAAHVQADGLELQIEGDARTELHRLMNGAPHVHFGPPLVAEGEPWRRILDIAKQLEVDLIVLGSHRYHGLDRVLGTVAAKVVNHADRNVLVVRPRQAP